MSNYTFKTSVVTIRDVEHEVVVNFDYSPPEEEKFNPLEGIGTPYSPAEVSLLSVDTVLFNAKSLNFVDVADQLPQSEWDLLEMRAFDYVEEVEGE